MAQMLAGQLTISQASISELNTSYRLLLGPGPCNVDPHGCGDVLFTPPVRSPGER